MARAAHVIVSLATAACAFGAVTLPASPARAEEPPLETADGMGACRDFEAKNDRERRDFEKLQPPTPYVYPQDDTVLGAPWGPMVRTIGANPGLVLATVLPHLGGQYRGGQPGIVLSWPLTFPIGPATACSRKPGGYVLRKYKSHRILLEPGVNSGQYIGGFLRPGYRFLYHPSDWVVGIGGGLGSTLEVGNKEPKRASLGPEGVIQFGHCCDPGYFTLALRYDHFFAGVATEIVWGSLGFTYF